MNYIYVLYKYIINPSKSPLTLGRRINRARSANDNREKEEPRYQREEMKRKKMKIKKMIQIK